MKSMDEHNKHADRVDVVEGLDERGSSRRRWLKKAGSVSPGLLLLANRPAMAASCSVSGFMSAKVGTSLTTYEPSTCNGWSPGNWKNQNGQIGSDSWTITGCTPGTPFNSQFSTANMSHLQIRKVVNGTPEPTPLGYQSLVSSTLQSQLQGGPHAMQRHATASYLSSKFLQNGGGTSRGRTPEPWMLNFPAPDYIVGLYLLWEISHVNNMPAYQLNPGDYYQLETGGGAQIGRSDLLSHGDYANFFESISDGGASTW